MNKIANNILNTIFICTIATLSSCATYELDITNGSLTTDQITTIEEKRLKNFTVTGDSAHIEKIGDIGMPFSRYGLRVILNPGEHDVSISCWANLENIVYKINVTLLASHHYIARCKTSFGGGNTRLWAEIIDKDTGDQVGRSQTTIISNLI